MGADPGTPEHDTASAAASAGTAALATSQDQLAPVHTNGSLTPTAQGDQSREQGKQGPSIQSPASALADLLSTLELATPAPAAKPAAAEAAEPAHAADAQTTSKEAAAVPAAERPEAARPGDVTVGLCYDPVMEQHVGPPSEACTPLMHHCVTPAMHNANSSLMYCPQDTLAGPAFIKDCAEPCAHG